MGKRVITCLTIATVIIVVAVLQSGAPARVHAAEAIALVFLSSLDLPAGLPGMSGLL
jgi:hypothetical protein